MNEYHTKTLRNILKAHDIKALKVALDAQGEALRQIGEVALAYNIDKISDRLDIDALRGDSYIESKTLYRYVQTRQPYLPIKQWHHLLCIVFYKAVQQAAQPLV